MNLSNINGGIGDEVVVSIDISNLTYGMYEAMVRISDPNAINDPLDVPITLNVAPPSPHITILSPNGGEIWEVNREYEIQWSSYNTTGNVNIYYSVDNGVSWNVIMHSTSDIGYYSWTIPNTPSTNCLVKITDTDDNPADIVEDNEYQAFVKEKVMNLIDGLSDRDRDIILSRKFMEVPIPLHELAEKYDVSLQRIQQIESNVVKRLTALVSEL